MYIYIDFVYLFRNVLYKYLTKRHSQNISYISTLFDSFRLYGLI